MGIGRQSSVTYTDTLSCVYRGATHVIRSYTTPLHSNNGNPASGPFLLARAEERLYTIEYNKIIVTISYLFILYFDQSIPAETVESPVTPDLKCGCN